MTTMDQSIIIGRVIGPGGQAGQIRIQTRDNTYARIGEFVSYYEEGAGLTREIIGVIVERQLSRSLPASYFADPELDAGEIAEALGFSDSLDFVEYELVATVLGYLDSKLGLVNPRLNPKPNTPIYLASEGLLSEALFLKKAGQPGAAQVGQLLLRPEVAVLLDIQEMISTHFTILAGTGSGKSYLMRVLVEELLMPQNNAALLIFDPHAEYASLKESSSLTAFKAEVRGFPKVKIFRPGDNLKLSIHELSYSDIRFLLKDVTEKMRSYIEKICEMAKASARTQHREWRYDDLQEALDTLTDTTPDDEKTINGLRWRLRDAFGRRENNIFVDDAGLALQEIFKPGQCSIIELDGIEEREQQTIAAILLRKTLQARMKRKTQRESAITDLNDLPYPVCIILEEAHRFAPAGGGEAISNTVLKTILSEGRKFGVGVGLITQRPGKLEGDVLSQCMTQFLLRIINPIDQESVKKGVESVSRELLDELPGLSKGQAIVSGVAVRSPVLINVRTALTPHGGESIRLVEQWLAYNKPEKVIDRKLENVARKPSSGSEWDKL
ncbi:MAG: ATP-binding protein [Candidatus Caenarcaniphilales bacterium]|nr:ATP-binding protein [Candidatus Caenarcaniphilales bacterium]